MNSSNKEFRPLAAHLRTDESSGAIDVQTLREHNSAVAKLAAGFAHNFDSASVAYTCGLSHDLGKGSSGFQKRIWESGPKVDHSTAGAYAILQRAAGTDSMAQNSKDVMAILACKDPGALAAAYCVSGHHSGLMNGGDRACQKGTLSGRIYRYQTNLPEDTCKDLVKPHTLPRLSVSKGMAGFCMSFWIRMLYSCLVDADYLDTEKFMDGEKAGMRRTRFNLKELCDRLNSYIMDRGFLNGKSNLNVVRSRILKECIDAGESFSPGLMTLTVPTGGGKTISSLAFALHHAIRQNMERVIYVIPYCSIIDQTVDIFQEILGKESVLAHYSEMSFEEPEDEYYPYKRLASENWDMPVIVTTGVQFFESIFSNRPGSCRKLHNLAKSVIIFDEAQALPINYLKPCINATAELLLNYHSSIVLCTATQPSLNDFYKEYHPSLLGKEISPSAMEYADVFKRVTYHKEGLLDDTILADRLNECHQVLCIVGSRKHAKVLYDRLEGTGNYHLSTWMAPKDRKEAIREIRVRLENGETCRVISTSLIEAGIDVDFPEVYRSYAGLDSEIQAAGRCNRKGRLPAEQCIVHLFEPDRTYALPSSLQLPKEIAESVTKKVIDIDSPEVIENYFHQLYYLRGKDALDSKHIIARLNEDSRLISYPFADISDDFNMIEQDTYSVIVPLDEKSYRLCDRLQNDEPISKEEYRFLGAYTVDIYHKQYKDLLGSLYPVNEKTAILINPELYNHKTGLSVKDKEGVGLFF